MIGSANRIKKQSFPGVLRGKSVLGLYFKAILTDLGDKNTQIGVVLPKKYAKTAVLRNLIRRTVYGQTVPYLDKIPYKNIAFLLQKAFPIGRGLPGRQQVSQIVAEEVQGLIKKIIPTEKYEK